MMTVERTSHGQTPDISAGLPEHASQKQLVKACKKTLRQIYASLHLPLNIFDRLRFHDTSAIKRDINYKTIDYLSDRLASSLGFTGLDHTLFVLGFEVGSAAGPVDAWENLHKTASTVIGSQPPQEIRKAISVRESVRAEINNQLVGKMQPSSNEVEHLRSVAGFGESLAKSMPYLSVRKLEENMQEGLRRLGNVKWVSH